LEFDPQGGLLAVHSSTGSIFSEIIVIFVLIAINALLAMSEMAIVSARKSKLKQLAVRGSAGAKIALELANAPSFFLASIQIGITMIGILTGAFTGAKMGSVLSEILAQIPLLEPYSQSIGFGLVVVVVTLVSLLFGELIPKRFALARAEGLATVVARPVKFWANFSRPAVRILEIITDGVIALLGAKSSGEAPVSEEEVRILIEQGAEFGVFEQDEKTIIRRALSFGDRKVSEVMTPRPKLVILNADAPFTKTMDVILAAPHSYFPVSHGSLDHIIGVVAAKSVLECLVRDKTCDLRKVMVEPIYVPEGLPVLKLLERFKTGNVHLAMAVDEYGTYAGLVTAMDVLQAVVGDLPVLEEQSDRTVIMRDDGTLLASGMLSVHEFGEVVSIEISNEPDEGDYQTLGGFMMAKLGHIPREGEKIEWKGHIFEVVDMDGRRVDKVLVTPRKGKR
jgi:putative hemolysin